VLGQVRQQCAVAGLLDPFGGAARADGRHGRAGRRDHVQPHHDDAEDGGALRHDAASRARAHSRQAGHNNTGVARTRPLR
jgi:hypothetical protein